MSLSPRISLLNVLLFTSLIALGLAYYLARVELSASRAELDTLRNDIGLLRIDDATKIQALELPALGPYEWRWRVYLPQNAKYRLCYAFSNIPAKGKPELYMQDDRVLTPRPSPTGNKDSFVISTCLFRDLQGKMKLSLRGPSQSAVHNPGDCEWFATGKPEFSISEGVSGRSSTSSFSKSELVLLRWRRGMATASGATPSPSPTDGAMFWIEKID